MTDAKPNHVVPDAPPSTERDAAPDPAPAASRPTSSADVRSRRPDYKGSELDPERGPGLGCFWFQVIVLGLFIVLIPIGLNLGWPFELLAFLLFVVIGLLLLTGQTVIFLLRLVAADRRAQGRRRPLASPTRTVGEMEDEHRVVDATGGARPAIHAAVQARRPSLEPPPPAPEMPAPGAVPPDAVPPAPEMPAPETAPHKLGTPAPDAAPPAPGTVGEAIADRESIIGDLRGESPGLTADEATLMGAATGEARIISSGASANEAPGHADEAIESAEATREPTADDLVGEPAHDSLTLGQRILWVEDASPAEGVATDAASTPGSADGAPPAAPGAQPVAADGGPQGPGDEAPRRDDATADAGADAPDLAGGDDDTPEEPDPGMRQ